MGALVGSFRFIPETHRPEAEAFSNLLTFSSEFSSSFFFEGLKRSEVEFRVVRGVFWVQGIDFKETQGGFGSCRMGFFGLLDLRVKFATYKTMTLYS